MQVESAQTPIAEAASAPAPPAIAVGLVLHEVPPLPFPRSETMIWEISGARMCQASRGKERVVFCSSQRRREEWVAQETPEMRRLQHDVTVMRPLRTLRDV
jgi:hypothetical protein